MSSSLLQVPRKLGRRGIDGKETHEGREKQECRNQGQQQILGKMGGTWDCLTAHWRLLLSLGLPQYLCDYGTVRYPASASGTNASYDRVDTLEGGWTMTQDRPLELSSLRVDIGRVVKDGHGRIPALFHLYLGTPADSRQALTEQILQQLASHLELEEGLLFQEIRKLGPQGRKPVEDAELEHEEVKAMIFTLQ